MAITRANIKLLLYCENISILLPVTYNIYSAGISVLTNLTMSGTIPNNKTIGI